MAFNAIHGPLEADAALVAVRPICLSYNYALPNKLFEAIQGHVPVVEALIAAGAGVDAATKDGATPLYIAAQNGHVAAAEERTLEALYTVTLRHLSVEDAMAIQTVMTEEFPGYRSHMLIRRGSALRRYEYATSAGAAELERWLTLLLIDMGLDPEGAVALSVRNGDIRIERVLPARAERPAVD